MNEPSDAWKWFADRFPCLVREYERTGETFISVGVFVTSGHHFTNVSAQIPSIWCVERSLTLLRHDARGMVKGNLIDVPFDSIVAIELV